MGKLEVTSYLGQLFDNNSALVFPSDQSLLPAIWCFCSSPEYNEAVRRIDQKLNVTNETLVKVPFDLEHWTRVAKEQYPNGLPKPYTNDPTQWIFHGSPCGSVFWDERLKWTAVGEARIDDTVLQIAVARLLGYRWPAEIDPDMELADEQRKLVASCETLPASPTRTASCAYPPCGNGAPQTAYSTSSSSPPTEVHGKRHPGEPCRE